MSGPIYPDVPFTAGVPAVLRSASAQAIAAASLMTADGSDIAQLAASQWGIYKAAGGIALRPDNITALNYRAEHRLADYPIEEGGFETYDKVAMPFDITVRMTKGGTVSARSAFLKAVEAIRGDRKLYNVTTPEATYLNVNIVEVQVDRSQESGAGLIVIDIHLREIRQNAKAAFSKAKDPAGVSPYNNGSTQTVAPPANPGTVQ